MQIWRKMSIILNLLLINLHYQINVKIMNVKKSVLSVLLLFICSNVLTTLWYMLTDDSNFVSFRRSEINYGGLMLNHLLFVIGFVYLFPFFIRDQNTKLKAFVFGLIIAAIMFLPTGLVVRSIWKVDFNLIFVLNTIVHAVIGGILGIVISIIYNYKKHQNETNKG